MIRFPVVSPWLGPRAQLISVGPTRHHLFCLIRTLFLHFEVYLFNFFPSFCFTFNTSYAMDPTKHGPDL
jgi:hypothetical protein